MARKSAKKPVGKPVKKTKAAAKPPPRKARGLPVKRVIDVDKREELRRNMEAAPALPGRPPTLPTMPSVLPDGRTEEQRAVEDAGRFAMQLLKEEDIFGATHAMICMRQGYIVAYREYQELVARKRQLAEEKGEALPVMAEDFLVQYAMWQATKPFNEHQFMDLLLKTAMPWLGEVIDRHSGEDERQTQEDHDAAEQARRSTPVPIGFKSTVTLEEPVLDRARSLVLVGWERAVLWLMDMVCGHVLGEAGVLADGTLGEPFTVVRFMRAAPRVGDQHRHLIRVGGKAWAGCTDSDKRLALCMGEYVADRLSGQPDLVVCDHLPAAHTGGFAGRPEAAAAGDAHRRFRKWCDKAGAAFLGGVCLDGRDEPDTTEPAFEQLRTFTDLRVVSVRDEGDKYLVSVGRGAAVFEADKTEVDACGRGTIALPHGIDRIVT